MQAQGSKNEEKGRDKEGNRTNGRVCITKLATASLLKELIGSVRGASKNHNII